MSQTTPRDTFVVSGGVAGLIAATFLARANLNTLVANDDEPIVHRNAHLEDVPGLPAGVSSRLLTDLFSKQADRNGVGRLTGHVIDLGMLGDDEDPLFRATVETNDGEETIEVSRIVVASWSDASYLENAGVSLRAAGSRTYVGVDDLGRTDVPDIYATDRLTGIYHQTAVAVGDVAETAIILIHDSGAAFYSDWVAPAGYFIDRGHEVSPACEEINADERTHRGRGSREVMREFFAEPHGEPQRTYPNLVDDELGRLDE